MEVGTFELNDIVHNLRSILIRSNPPFACKIPIVDLPDVIHWHFHFGVTFDKRANIVTSQNFPMT